MFSGAKVGDRVFDYILQKWGQIGAIKYDQACPIIVSFDEYGTKNYTIDGRDSLDAVVPVLFWDEVKPITPPDKPLPKLKVDTRVLVWDGDKEDKLNRYFSHFSSNGNMHCFSVGCTSWSSNGDTVPWANWKLAE